LFTMGSALANTLDQAIAVEKQTTKASVQSQKKIDRFADETVDMAAEYRLTLEVIESMKIYNDSLEKLIKSQEEEMVSIEQQMKTIDATARGVVPLMNEMIVKLENLITVDIPFHKEKRAERVAGLKEMMGRADVSTAEKYRKILEAYQTELAYGESMDSYIGDMGDRKVEFLRIGRVLLVFLTLDGKQAGYYNPESREFEELDSGYISSIQRGLKIANKQAAPELIKLPVPAAKGAN